jgi:hypothetical protein
VNDVWGCTPPVLDAIRDAPMLGRRIHSGASNSGAEGVCCRRSEEEEQFPEVGWLHVGAQGQRGSSRVIEKDAQGAGPVLGLAHRGVSGQLPGGRIEVMRGALADSAEPRWWSEAHLGTGWCAHRQ